MARIREALRRPETRRSPPPPDGLASCLSAREEVPSGTAEVEEVPFIEVGGRDTPVEASPSVLASAEKPDASARTALAGASGSSVARGGESKVSRPEVRLTVLYISFCTQEG